ncbi:MAG: hypothetical protein LBD53_01525 [Tannerella sp.]|jgi:hypothetical protein|nr:hypothetical protein [Tannerella sp.]
MTKKVLILLTLSALSNLVGAQDWSREDSIWLLNVLDGKTELKINEDTKKSIKEGKLIAPEWMKDSLGNTKKIDVRRDFSNAGAVDSTHISRIDPYSMPPAVYALYVLYMDKLDSLYQETVSLLSPEERAKLEEALPAGARQTVGFSVSPTGATTGIVMGGLDFNHILSMVFSPSYRQIAHNRKHATAYKNYYDAGAIQPSFKMTESERKQLRKSANEIIKIEFKKD